MNDASLRPSCRSYLSSPSHAVVIQRDVYPMNQTSLVRLDVPVLPAEISLVARIGAECPVVTISRSSRDVSHAATSLVPRMWKISTDGGFFDHTSARSSDTCTL